jgi:hypothetical protein
MKEFFVKKKGWFLIPLLIIVVAVIWYISSTQWTRDFDLKYVEYVSDLKTGNSYRIYEITNNTNYTLKNVSVVISVEYYNGEFKYEDTVASSIRPGETVKYKLYDKDYKKAAEEQDKFLIFGGNPEIVRIKYSR